MVPHSNKLNFNLYENYKYRTFFYIFPPINKDLKMARIRRRRYYRKKNKWNIEQRPIDTEVTSTWSSENGFRQKQLTIVPESATEGVRKAGRFNIKLTYNDSNLTAPPPLSVTTLYWALMYIPEGATTTGLFPTSTELVRPSNFVLGSGVVNGQNGVISISSRLYKNLNANDKIVLYLATGVSNNSIRFLGLVKYAICYN